MLKLKETNIDESISIKDMRVGQIGIITEWDVNESVKATIVKRMKLGLCSLTTNEYWEEEALNHTDDEDIERYRVKILSNGTELVICNNE